MNIVKLASYLPLIAAGACVFCFLIVKVVFRRGAMISFLSHALLAGLFVGGISFLIGFFGPMIYGFLVGRDLPQGPLLGFFITGPIGIAFGLLAGTGWWLFRLWKPKSGK